MYNTTSGISIWLKRIGAHLQKSVLCRIRKQYYPNIVQDINKWINYRYKILENTSLWEETNQIQLNCYRKGGKIQAHYDSFDWFSQILLYKAIHHSGLHLAAWSYGTTYNPYLFHSLSW